jgi:glutathione S-transferase
MIEVWELGGKNDCRYSTFSWRTRLAMLHKGLAFETHPVSVTDKDAIRFSGQEMVPVIRDGDLIVSDSWKIACYLEQTYPNRPTLFGGELGQNLTFFFNMWADRELIPMLVPPLMLDVLACVGEKEAAHHRKQMETIFKRKLEDLYGERAKSLEQFRKRLAPVRKIIADQPFMGGRTPAYADPSYSAFCSGRAWSPMSRFLIRKTPSGAGSSESSIFMGAPADASPQGANA